jgi:hypothetical protein
VIQSLQFGYSIRVKYGMELSLFTRQTKPASRHESETLFSDRVARAQIAIDIISGQLQLQLQLQWSAVSGQWSVAKYLDHRSFYGFVSLGRGYISVIYRGYM